MTVEIRELLIKAYVQDANEQSSQAESSSNDKEEIIADCMEQISQLLKEQLER